MLLRDFPSAQDTPETAAAYVRLEAAACRPAGPRPLPAGLMDRRHADDDALMREIAERIEAYQPA